MSEIKIQFPERNIDPWDRYGLIIEDTPTTNFSNDCHSPEDGRFCEGTGAKKSLYDTREAVYEAAERLSGNHPYGSTGRTLDYYGRAQTQANRIVQGRTDTGSKEDLFYLKDAAILMSAIPQSPNSDAVLYRGTEEYEVSRNKDGAQLGDQFNLPLGPVTPDRRTADFYSRGIIIKIETPIPWIKTEGSASIEEGIVSGRFEVTDIDYEMDLNSNESKVITVRQISNYQQQADNTLLANGWDFGPDLSLQASAEFAKHKGNFEALRRWYNTGGGADRIAWGTKGDFTRCMKLVAKYIPAEDVGGFCFTGDTEFMTVEGLMTFKEAVDTDQMVLTAPTPHAPVNKNGRWVQGSIESFGEQPVLTVTLERSQARKTIRATREHVWFASSDSRSVKRLKVDEVRTEDLKPGMALASLLPRRLSIRSSPSPFGVAAGFVFGDGNREGNKGCRVALWGEKDAALIPYFIGCQSGQVKNKYGTTGTRFSGIPSSWKAAPALDEGVPYLLGWLAGYIAADGSVSETGAVSLYSASRENLELAATIGHRLGISSFAVRLYRRKGFADTPEPIYSISFVAETVSASLLIIPEHRRRFEAAAEKRTKQSTPLRWRVVSVEDHGEAEEVFCAVVPDTHTFALADHVWVHNCQNRHMEIYGESNAARDAREDKKKALAARLELANDCHDPATGRFCETPGAPGHEGHSGVPGEGNINPVERDEDWFQGPDEMRGSAMWPDGIRPIADQYAADVTEDEWQALRAYTTNDYRYVNRRLDDPNGYNAEPEYADGQIKLIDAALEKTPTFPEPIEVFRGVAMPHLSQEQVKAYVDRTYTPGAEISMSKGGYQSTSLGVEAPLDQSLSQTNNGFIFEVKAHRGAPLMGSTTYLDESEVLMSRHDRFKVISVQHDVEFVKGIDQDIVTRTVIQVEQIV